MTISMQVEAHPGQDITEASSQAINVANHLGINVQFDFNGVTCIANPGSRSKALAESYHRELARGGDFQIAFDRREK